jgi:hypothetical protein
MSQIEITPALLSDLRQKAEAATQGPWNQQGLASLLRFAQKHDGPWNDDEYIDCTLQLPEEKDADYIAAASPAVVLALVAEVERLRDRLDDLVCSGCDQQPKFCSCEVVPLSGSDQRG